MCDDHSTLFPPWAFSCSCKCSWRPLRHLAARRVILGDDEIDRTQQVAEVRPGERHGLYGRPVKRPVRTHQEHPGLTELRRFLDACGGHAAAGGNEETPAPGGRQIEPIADDQIAELPLGRRATRTLVRIAAD